MWTAILDVLPQLYESHGARFIEKAGNKLSFRPIRA